MIRSALRGWSAYSAEYDGRYGHFHTTSANVEWMADLPCRDRLVGVWSTTCEAVARDVEPGAGKAIDRIEAARKCQEMGIPVRYKFKPVIPVRNWREEYAWILEQAVKRTQPESIGFCLYIWNTYESMEATIPLDLLEPECVAAAREALEQMKGVRTGPFPPIRRQCNRSRCAFWGFLRFSQLILLRNPLCPASSTFSSSSPIRWWRSSRAPTAIRW